MAVITVRGEALVALFSRGFEPDHNGLLTDVEVAEAADQAHAIELACLFLESADEKHITVICFEIFCRSV